MSPIFGIIQIFVFDDAALIPSVPYYELPAGMMMPLIEMEDVLVTFSVPYKPVIVSKLRLPPPIPPTERLLRAMDAFYAPQSLENQRDTDGWERNGLLEYYSKKNEIKKKVEEQLKEEGKTLEDAIENVYIEETNEEKDEKRNYRQAIIDQVLRTHHPVGRALIQVIDRGDDQEVVIQVQALALDLDLGLGPCHVRTQ
ncbi:unnamed protein product, partial [Brugia timori]|uniref:XRN_M domain-containing protein n=1 Tax=Brugia timori TaxID=42155 RepID=A0A0R3RD77_9BILA